MKACDQFPSVLTNESVVPKRKLVEWQGARYHISAEPLSEREICERIDHVIAHAFSKAKALK